VLVAAAFCPQPPLLVPQLAAGAAAELDDLRTACDLAVRSLTAAGADRISILGAGQAARYHAGGQGNLSGYGVAVPIRFGVGDAPVPLPLLLGAWLLSRSAPGVPATGMTIGPTGAIGVGWPDRYDRAPAGLLVMGDGSARLAAHSPGGVDPRAVPFDAQARAALASGEPARLRELDPALGAELLAAGTPAWVAAGSILAGASYTATVHYDAAPYGVGYLVASWVRP
jgi:hypothetical protein